MRDQILIHAEVQMKAGGFANLNFGTIAKHLETSRANLHYHFKNKEQLAIEVTQHYGMNQFTSLSTLYSQLDGDFFRFIEAAEHFFWEEARSIGSTGLCVCTQMATEPGLPKSLKALALDFYRKFEELHITAIQGALDKGQIRKDINVAREATRAHVIIMGIMTCGQHIGDVGLAFNEMQGLLLDWANGLK